MCGGIHKEPHFFDHMYDFNSTRTRFDYMELFPHAVKCKKRQDSRYIDGTTIMARMNTVIGRMAEVMITHNNKILILIINKLYTAEEKKKLKFIVILREPVARDYSWYCQVMRDRLAAGTKFIDMDTFMEADHKGLSEKITHIHRAGRYVDQLSSYMKYFKRDQLLVLSSSAIFKNSSKVMDSVAKFLDIEKIDKWNGPFPHDDHLGESKFIGLVDCVVNHIPSLDCQFKEELGKYYQPYNEKLYKWLEDTKNVTSKWEPDFVKFGDTWSNVACVKNSREAYNKIIHSNKTIESCRIR